MKLYLWPGQCLILVSIFVSCMTEDEDKGPYCPHDVHDDIPGDKIQLGKQSWCLGYLDISVATNEEGYATAVEACRYLFNGTVLPPIEQMQHLSKIRQKAMHKTIITRPIENFTFVKEDETSAVITVWNEIFDKQTLTLSKLAFDWINKSSINHKGSSCLVYKFDVKKATIEKAISCAHRSFTGVVCIGPILSKCKTVVKSSRSCKCSDEFIYEDRFCLHGRDPCKARNPCRHGSSCITINNKLYCDCYNKARYSGARCEIDSKPCEKVNCNNGRCKIVQNKPFCQCNKGYRGKECSEKTDWCKNQYCEGNATCISGESTFTCKCPSGRSGLHCETFSLASGMAKPLVVGLIGGGTFLVFMVLVIFALTRRRKIKVRRMRGGSPMETSVYGKPVWQSLMESTKFGTTATSKSISKTNSSTTNTKSGSSSNFNQMKSPAAMKFNKVTLQKKT